MSLGFRVPGTGDRNIDAVLWGVRWKATELTYSFPEDADGYSGEEPNIDLAEFQPVTADLADAIRFILETQFPAVAQLTFREVAPGSDSMLTFGTLTSEETAHANIPRFSPDSYAGDIWFNQQQFNLAPIGSYAYFTAMHEIGHSLGLKHGHDGGSPVEYGVSTLPLTADRDSVEFSIMTYRPYTAANFEYYTIPDGSYPQTPMMYDIAALQYLYGANYETNAGDTVYRFDRDTGEMSVNGVGQGAPSANVILRTIWDGGGNDTYDFSNYEADLRIDLSPGGWTVLGTEQRATMGQMEVAQAHLYNALLYQDDPRSLIENAIGGSGDDTIFGNGADNRLEGGLGTNILDGRGGFDTAVIAAALTDITYSFEGRYLAFERPDEKGDLAIRIEAFAFSDGTVIRDDGFALLDDLYYYTQNHDIWLAGADAEAHYAASGWREGARPQRLLLHRGLSGDEPGCGRGRYRPAAALPGVRLEGAARPLRRLRHRRLSGALHRCGGGRDQPARALPGLWPGRGPAAAAGGGRAERHRLRRQLLPAVEPGRAAGRAERLGALLHPGLARGARPQRLFRHQPVSGEQPGRGGGRHGSAAALP
ncbi:M10 family metallopeptidase [Pseudoroseomonas cervicalis]|uniref:M10 family metallopeptidase n=1 Tax=Teichococcus cervicalis TaxID=204525 RepID=UPI0035EFB20B